MTEGRFPPKLRDLLREKIRLPDPHRWSLYGASGLVWLSGALWLGIEKACGTGNSQWSPRLLEIHGAAAMIFLVLAGSIWPHMRRGLALRRNRVSGIGMAAFLGFLTLTGWMLYYVGDETWRNAASIAHWGAGLALPILLASHILLGRRSFRKGSRSRVF
jgi:hypothetical protein